MWNLISSTIIEGSTCLISSETIIKNINIPITAHIARNLYKNFLIFMHNIIIIIIISMYFLKFNIVYYAVSILGLFLVFSSMLPLCLAISLISLRYRDFPLIVSTCMQLIFFISPIFFRPCEHKFISIKIFIFIF